MKIFIDFNPKDGFPAKKGLFYECGVCGDDIPSLPDHSTACSCRNIIIDTDAGRISVKNESWIKLFKKGKA